MYEGVSGTMLFPTLQPVIESCEDARILPDRHQGCWYGKSKYESDTAESHAIIVTTW